MTRKRAHAAFRRTPRTEVGRQPAEGRKRSVPFVRTADNLADILTKPMKDAKQFHKLRKVIMNDRSQ